MEGDLVGSNRPIISVKEARKTLGKEAVNMTDEEVERVVNDLHELAKIALDEFSRQKKK